MEATKRPWRLGVGEGKGCIFADKGRLKLEDRGTTLYPICILVDLDGEIQANAALIVRAVNSHDALVEALKDMKRYSSIIPVKFQQDIWDIINPAIQQAERRE